MVGLCGNVSGNKHGSISGVLGFSPQACSLLLTTEIPARVQASFPGCDRHCHTWNAAFPSFVLEGKSVIQSGSCVRGRRSV